MHSTMWNFCILLLFVCYVKLGQIFFLLKRIRLVLFSPKWIHNFLSANHLHTFANSLQKTFSILQPLYVYKKILVSPVCRYVWPFERACTILFLYTKTIKVSSVTEGVRWVRLHQPLRKTYLFYFILPHSIVFHM